MENINKKTIMNTKYAHLMIKNSLTRNRPGVMLRDAPHFDLDSWKDWTNWNHFDIVLIKYFILIGAVTILLIMISKER